MSAFEAKGGRARWLVVLDLLLPMSVGDVLAYDEAQELLGWDLRVDRSPFYRALQEMEANHHRTLTAVRGRGYRMVEATEHEKLGLQQHMRGRRALTRSVRKFSSADRQKLTGEQIARLDSLEMNVAAQARMLRHLDGRVAVVEKDTGRLDDRVDVMVAALRRHGITLD